MTPLGRRTHETRNWMICVRPQAPPTQPYVAPSRRSSRANVFRVSCLADAVRALDVPDDQDCRAYGFAARHNHGAGQRITFGRSERLWPEERLNLRRQFVTPVEPQVAGSGGSACVDAMAIS